MRKWSEEAMSCAVAAVKAGMSIRKAAIQYSVPKSTLSDRTTGKIAEGAKWGRESFLQRSTEQEMIDVAKDRADMGIGFSKSNFLRFASTVAQKDGKGFKNGKPSDMWWRRLKLRHQTFSLRSPEATATVRHDAMSRPRLSKYFASLKSVIDKYNFSAFPERIWNMDETGVNLFHKPKQVIAKKGTKTVHGKASGSRETVTVIACVNAKGATIPPHFVIPGKTKKKLHGYDLQSANTSSPMAGANFSVSDSGWTKEGIGKLWFSETFLKSIGPARPQLLIFDGHSSHNNIEFIELARKENIILVELPSHTSNWTQPLDRCVFKSLKSNWNTELDNFVRITGIAVGHVQFIKIFGNAWEKSMTPQNIISGFRSTGIHPFNENAIPNEAYMPCNTTLSATAQIPNHSESNVVKGDAGTTVTSSSEENECNVAITPIVDAVSTGLLTNARSNGTDVPTSPPTTIRSETDNDDSRNISDVTLSIPLDAEGIFDLSLMLDPNGTLLMADDDTASGNDKIDLLNELATNNTNKSLNVVECTDQKALEVIESTLTSAQLLQFSTALMCKKDLDDPLYQTWKLYNSKQLNTEEVTSTTVQSVANEFFPVPIKNNKRKQMKDSYFVISADEAYQQKVEELEQKKRLKEEKETRKIELERKRLLRKVEKEKKLKIREEKKKIREAKKS